MAKKESVSKEIAEIKKELASKKVLIGTNVTMKKIRDKSLKKIFLCSNCNKETVEKITRYCNMVNIPIQKLNHTNVQLGTVCKKPYSISVLGILK